MFRLDVVLKPPVARSGHPDLARAEHQQMHRLGSRRPA